MATIEQDTGGINSTLDHSSYQIAKEDYRRTDSTASPSVGRGGPHTDSSQAVTSQLSTPSTSLPVENLQEPALQVTIEDTTDIPPLTIPFGHRCGTDSLLMLPQVQSLIGQYPDDFFFRVESQRLLPSTQAFNTLKDHLELPEIDQESSLSLRNSFFQSSHLVNPFLDEATYTERYISRLDHNEQTLNERAVVLLVFALGSIGGKPVNEDEGPGEDNIPGMEFFKPALHILMTSWTTCFSGDITLAQGLILCSLYLCYIAQPLRAWKLIHMASITVQGLLIKCVSLPSILGRNAIV